MERAARLPGHASKTRLRKLVCADGCGYPPVRCSRAAIEQGLPSCPCGAVLWPWDLEDVELALAAGSLDPALYDAHPLVTEFRREWAKVTRGQHGHQKRASQLDSPDAIASLRVGQAVHQDAQASRLDAARAGGHVRQARADAANGAIDHAQLARRVAITRDADPIPF